MDKKKLTEADIRTKFITPAIVGVGGSKWDVMTQLREEVYFTKGRVIVQGKKVSRGKASKADYLLYLKPGLPLAVVEAKDNLHAVGAGMQQALEYAEILDVPFAYSSNGDGFLEHDRAATSGAVEREFPLSQFPTPEDLWQRFRLAKGYSDVQASAVKHDYFDDGSGKAPRYYYYCVRSDQLTCLCPQQGQQDRARISARPRSLRIVVIDVGWCRSGRTGRTPRAETLG